MTLTPAYGREYKSKASLLVDFEANKDFLLMEMSRSVLINKEQINHDQAIVFRYGKLRKVCSHVNKKENV